jgi:hypothetical protein
MKQVLKDSRNEMAITRIDNLQRPAVKLAGKSLKTGDDSKAACISRDSSKSFSLRLPTFI